MKTLFRLITPLILLFSSLSACNAAESTTTKILLETSKGNIVLELYPQLAPVTVKNFLSYVDEGYYNNTIFHRVINSFMIQGGGFDAELNKKDTHDAISNEADNGLDNDRGTIAMARTSDPNSATSQFFINHVDNDSLNHKSRSSRGWGYCVFGKVTQGMETVDAIADVFTTTRKGMQNVPEEPVLIIKASRL